MDLADGAGLAPRVVRLDVLRQCAAGGVDVGLGLVARAHDAAGSDCWCRGAGVRMPGDDPVLLGAVESPDARLGGGVGAVRSLIRVPIWPGSNATTPVALIRG